MESNKAVIYVHQPHNKINGSLFYCAEYFLELQQHQPVVFYIINLNTNVDKNIIEKAFQDKYNTPVNFVQIKITQLMRLNLNKILVLDIKSLMKIKDFFKNQIIAFSNNSHNIRNNNITFYGSYKYQNYEKECILKLGLTYHNDVKLGNMTFVSGPDIIPDNSNYLFKSRNLSHIGLFDKLNRIIYIHTGLDKNNRIIVEGFYHNKKVDFYEKAKIIDSSTIRYQDCLSGNINKYILDKNDNMIKDMLKD